MMRRSEHTTSLAHARTLRPASVQHGTRPQQRAVDPKTGRLYRIFNPALGKTVGMPRRALQSSSFSPPPHAIRRARLDNLAVVPASLLPNKAEWQAMANALPAGSTLIVLPAQPGVARNALEKISTRLAAQGSRVSTVQFDPRETDDSGRSEQQHPVHIQGQIRRGEVE